MRHQLQCYIVLMMMVVMIPMTSVLTSAEEAPEWRGIGIDPNEWNDRPEWEDSPMMPSYSGNAIIEMEVSYREGHFSSRTEGTVIIELFEQWAPITTENMISHVEDGLYDGIFFHRVIDDFVTQAGDPTCKRIGVYPATSPECGSGGTGETIPLEHHESLSHVDGAIGMARSADPDSADSQWYIAETEAHNLDPENRDDGGYATFGIVRDGMSHIRAIAVTPTSDDPTGNEDIQNPASSAGRPIYEATILSMKMIGVADPDGTIRNPPMNTASSDGLSSGVLISLLSLVLAIPAVWVIVTRGQPDLPLNLEPSNEYESETILNAELVEEDT